MGFFSKRKEAKAVQGKTKAHITGMAAATLDHVLNSEGLSTLLSGSLVLDNQLGVSFRTGVLSEGVDNIVAVVPIGNLEEAEILKAFENSEAGGNDAELFSQFTDEIVMAAMRIFESKSEELRDLPVGRMF